MFDLYIKAWLLMTQAAPIDPGGLDPAWIVGGLASVIAAISGAYNKVQNDRIKEQKETIDRMQKRIDEQNAEIRALGDQRLQEIKDYLPQFLKATTELAEIARELGDMADMAQKLDHILQLRT